MAIGVSTVCARARTPRLQHLQEGLLPLSEGLPRQRSTFPLYPYLLSFAVLALHSSSDSLSDGLQRSGPLLEARAHVADHIQRAPTTTDQQRKYEK